MEKPELTVTPRGLPGKKRVAHEAKHNEVCANAENAKYRSLSQITLCEGGTMLGIPTLDHGSPTLIENKILPADIWWY